MNSNSDEMNSNSGEVENKARELLRKFQGVYSYATVAKSMRPQEDDYQRVFREGVVEMVRTGYEEVWSRNPKPEATVEQSELILHCARVEDFLGASDKAKPFPVAYKAIAEYLQPEPVWICWKFSKKGKDEGMKYDGLVWVADHFAWFPKPWRYIS